MKKFKIIFTDSKTGHDLYTNFIVQDTSMARIANECDFRGANYRLIEDVTAHYPPSFVSSPWNTIPLRAFDNYKE